MKNKLYSHIHMHCSVIVIMIVHLMAIPVAYLYSHTYPVRTIGSLVPRPFTQHVVTLSAVAAHRVKGLGTRLAYRLTEMASGIDIFTVIFKSLHHWGY